MYENHQSLSSGPVEVSKASLLDSLLSTFGDLQKRFLGNTGRGCRQVLSLLFQLEEPGRPQVMPVHLHVHAHFAGEVHDRCRSF